ncbi:MAG: ABC transporter permease subunit [Planctomycetota bacterium]|nr:ABC transporter permease subunit [Planctomycetota bacterium]
MNSWLYLVFFSLRRQLRPRRLVVALVLFLVLAVLVGTRGLIDPWKIKSFGRWIIELPFCRFFLPIITLTLGTAVIGDDREDKTLVYLSIRPLSRWSIYLAKLLGALPLALGISLGAVFGLCAVASACGGLPLPLSEVFWMFLPTIALGTFAYLAFFGWLGAVFRNATLIGVAHVFLVEFFMGQVPGVLKRISISFYIRCMLYDTGSEHGLKPPRNPPSFLPVEGDEAATSLLVAGVGFMLLGMYWFSRREYRDLS